MFEKIIDAVKEFDTIIIHRHSKPDGDALGSQIGLREIIKENFPNKTVYAVGDGSARYGFMEGCQMDEIDDSVYENALAIVLDTSAAALISDDRYKTAKKTARIDHHIFCEEICEIEVTDTSYESCCGLITELARESGLKLSSLAAKSLYTGMVSVTTVQTPTLSVWHHFLWKRALTQTIFMQICMRMIFHLSAFVRSLY